MVQCLRHWSGHSPFIKELFYLIAFWVGHWILAGYLFSALGEWLQKGRSLPLTPESMTVLFFSVSNFNAFILKRMSSFWVFRIHLVEDEIEMLGIQIWEGKRRWSIWIIVPWPAGILFPAFCSDLLAIIHLRGKFQGDVSIWRDIRQDIKHSLPKTFILWILCYFFYFLDRMLVYCVILSILTYLTLCIAKENTEWTSQVCLKQGLNRI